MAERPKLLRNELVDRTPAVVEEVFSKFRTFGDIKSLSEEGTVGEIFHETPVGDGDRDGWLRLIGISVIGYFKQSGRETSKVTFIQELQSQLQADYLRFGDTWKKREIKGQLDRTYARLRDYRDQYENGVDQKFPWLKVAGNAIICLYRLDNPDYQK